MEDVGEKGGQPVQLGREGRVQVNRKAIEGLKDKRGRCGRRLTTREAASAIGKARKSHCPWIRIGGENPPGAGDHNMITIPLDLLTACAGRSIGFGPAANIGATGV